jgi:Tol biopolymer transport system component
LSSDEPERLTTGLNVFTISLSPNGRTLAYSVLTSSQNIWTVPIPLKGTISVTDAAAVTTGNQVIEGVDVSQDGRWSAFDSNQSGNRDIYKMPIGGGEPVQLTTDPAMDCCPTWSPDGNELAFHSFRTGNREIFVVSAEGGPAARITNHPAQDRHPHWSPNGHDIVFTSEDRTVQNNLFVVSRTPGEVGGETARRMTSDGVSQMLNSRWSPNGDVFAYDDLRAGVRVVPSAGGTSRVLSSFGMAPLWSRNGKDLYFRDPAGIWSMPPSGGGPRMLVKFDDPRRAPSRLEWSTDSTRFYFTLTEYESDVWVMEFEQDP